MEVIVVDDGSTDATEAIGRSYGDRIKYIRQPKDDKHGATAYIRALREARGKYVAILDHDDRWLPGKIAKQVEALENNPNAAVAFTRFRIIDEIGNDRGVSALVGASGDVFHMLLESNRFCHASTMFRPEIVEDVGGVNTEIGCGDWDLWLRISREHYVIALDDVLTEYRVHSRGYSQDPRKMVGILKNVINAQKVRWHSLDCVECHRASERGLKMTDKLYTAHFHAMARSANTEGTFSMFITALKKSPSSLLGRNGAKATVKSIVLYLKSFLYLNLS